MHDLFEQLCNLLDDEIERQENVLAVCKAQSQAVQTRDLEYLEAKTAALLALVQEVALAAGDRAKVLQAIMKEYELTSACPSLSDVVAAAPEPWRKRLADSHRRLRAVLNETRPIVLANASSLRSALRAMGDSLSILESAPEQGAGYDATGMGPAVGAGRASMIDQRG